MNAKTVRRILRAYEDGRLLMQRNDENEPIVAAAKHALDDDDWVLVNAENDLSASSSRGVLHQRSQRDEWVVHEAC